MQKRTIEHKKTHQAPAKAPSWLSSLTALFIFLVALAALFGLIFYANQTRQQPEIETQESQPATTVEVITPGESYLALPAKVTNEGVINVLAQTSGVVQRVNVKEGQQVARGQQLVSLSSNYQGANASALQLQLAEKNWLMTHANFWDQEKVDDINSELNHNTAWVTRWETNPNRSMMGNGDAYTSFSGLQNQELLELSDTMTQRGQQLSLDQAENNYFAAQIAASLMYPATPVSGTIEKVNVKVGDIVAAGQVIAVVKATKANVKLTVSVGEHLIRHLSTTDAVWFEYQGRRYPATLDYLPTTPTTGNSYALSLLLDDQTAQVVTHGDYVTLHLPLDTSQASNLLLPLNAIYQTQTAAYVYLVAYDNQGQAIAKQQAVTLGPVLGNLVTVNSGLQSSDRVITNSNLMDGQRLNIKMSQVSLDIGDAQASPTADVRTLLP
ncbi:HlyD family efflux transporter periplasmic adaptor subunit [bacterium]|nr:HlyD family efflux transporter periplasmic adaptor subunit [bacterium]